MGHPAIYIVIFSYVEASNSYGPPYIRVRAWPIIGTTFSVYYVRLHYVIFLAGNHIRNARKGQSTRLIFARIISFGHMGAKRLFIDKRVVVL